MIYPTRAAVIAAAAGAPVALLIAAVAPGSWTIALAWPVAILLLCLLDAWQGAGAAQGEIEVPNAAYVGEVREAIVRLSIASGPRLAEVAIDPSPLVALEGGGRLRMALERGQGSAPISIEMRRRGQARLDALWLRWHGSLGLVWRQVRLDADRAFPILPDLRPVYSQGAKLLDRHSVEGLLMQRERGEGSDFDALVEFRPGMDRRAIDWKHSARHSKLLAKRYQSERNNQIVFAVDSGRQMCEPVAGLPRVDRAISAMLLTAWVALKLGDRVALHAYDSRPRLASGLISGGSAFAELERVAAQIDYSGEETNHSFALTTMAARLNRRSLIILFTELTDTISADFLVRAVRRLIRRHLLLVVVLRDEELESVVADHPQRAEDVTRAVTAAALLRERRVVLTALQHLGVHVVESEHDRVPEQLVAAYLDLKRRNLL